MTLYQPFLDYAIATLEKRLDLAPYPIPEGFERKAGVMGKGKRQEDVLTTSYAFKTDKLRQIRAAHVQGGNSLQVLNFVIFSRTQLQFTLLRGRLSHPTRRTFDRPGYAAFVSRRSCLSRTIYQAHIADFYQASRTS